MSTITAIRVTIYVCVNTRAIINSTIPEKLSHAVIVEDPEFE